jgi:hypothetical protein
MKEAFLLEKVRKLKICGVWMTKIRLMNGTIMVAFEIPPNFRISFKMRKNYGIKRV